MAEAGARRLGRVRTLVYHGFAPGGGISLERLRRTAGQFARDLTTFKRKGDAIDLDDALLSQYRIALPILNTYGMRARFFVPSGRVGHSWHMNWKQLAEVAQHHAIECHTHSHVDLRETPDAEVEQDLLRCCELITLNIGRPPSYVAFPYEYVSDRLVRLAEGIGLTWVGPRETVTNMMDEHAPISSARYWASVYSGQRKAEPGGHEHLRSAEVLKHVEGPRVLDVGAGYAPIAKAIKQAHPGWSVAALDICACVVGCFAPYVLGSCYSLPFRAQSFSTVVACQLLEYLEDEATFLREAATVGKHIIVTVPNGLHPACSQLRVYDADRIATLMSSFGSIRQLYVTQAMVFCKLEVAA